MSLFCIQSHSVKIMGNVIITNLNPCHPLLWWIVVNIDTLEYYHHLFILYTKSLVMVDCCQARWGPLEVTMVLLVDRGRSIISHDLRILRDGKDFCLFFGLSNII